MVDRSVAARRGFQALSAASLRSLEVSARPAGLAPADRVRRWWANEGWRRASESLSTRLAARRCWARRRRSAPKCSARRWTWLRGRRLAASLALLLAVLQPDTQDTSRISTRLALSCSIKCQDAPSRTTASASSIRQNTTARLFLSSVAPPLRSRIVSHLETILPLRSPPETSEYTSGQWSPLVQSDGMPV